MHDFATQYFDFPRNHTSIIGDAIKVVGAMQKSKETRNSYDYIIHDVFTGGAEPIDLFTRDFIMGLSDLLRPDGIIAIVRTKTTDVIESITPNSPLTNIRTTPATSFFPSPPQSSAPSNPSSQNAACIAKRHHPKLQGRWTTPTWSCSAESRPKNSRSAIQSKRTS